MQAFSILSPSIRRGARRLAVLALPLLALNACTPDPEERAPLCPNPLKLADASTLTRYDGRGTDLRNLVVSAQLVDVKGACAGLLGHSNLTAHAHAEMLVTRGPAAPGREVDIPYIVAVMKGDQLLDHRAKLQHVVFPANVDTVQVKGEETFFDFPTKRGLGGDQYSIYVLFQLSPGELAANQRALQK